MGLVYPRPEIADRRACENGKEEVGDVEDDVGRIEEINDVSMSPL